MVESERLARQLMEEEEALLCERIQQEQMRIVSQLRQAQQNAETDNDLAIAMRLAVRKHRCQNLYSFKTKPFAGRK